MEPPWAAEEGKQPMNNVNLRKIAVIGCGFVGSASAFALMQSKLFSEIVLIDELPGTRSGYGFGDDTAEPQETPAEPQETPAEPAPEATLPPANP